MSGSGHNRLLKILHIDPERNWGGGEAQVVGLLSYLAEKGHQNSLLTHPRGRLFEEGKRLNIRIFPLVVRNDLDLRPVFWLRRLIHDEKYDIVHLHTKRAHTLSLWLPRGGRAPKYVVTRRMDYVEPASWYMRHLYCRRVDGVVAISNPIAQSLIAAGMTPQRIRLIPSGIDPAKFTPSTVVKVSRNEKPVVGTVAVLEERKGHRFLLEAAALLKAQGHQIKYFVAGDGSLRQALEQMTENLKLRDEVRFLGFVSDTPAFLSRLDVFVLPSLHEGLGVAALEAMAARKAVIASRVGGLAEVVVDSVTGLLVPPGDPRELAGAISKLLRQPSLAEQMGRNGSQRVAEYFTMEKMAKRNEAYYYELAGG